MSADKPEWDDEGRDWPNRAASRFVEAGGLRWHVQVMGEGPLALMLHGTGAATHSWRDLAPLLAKCFTLVMPDLPGHGFTELPARRRLTLDGMSALLGELVQVMGMKPDLAIGHSAGAAIAMRMTLDGSIAPRRVVSLNGALMPFEGLAGFAFPVLAKIMFLNPLSVPIVAHRASKPGAVKRLIEGTGSVLDARGLDFYDRLFRTRRHIAGVTGMLAHWDLRALKQDMKRFAPKLTLICGSLDKAVPLNVAGAVAGVLPGAEKIVLDGLGHLAHEEAPERVAAVILDAVGVPDEVSKMAASC